MERMTACASAALYQMKNDGGVSREEVSPALARTGHPRRPVRPARHAKSIRRTPTPQTTPLCGIAGPLGQWLNHFLPTQQLQEKRRGGSTSCGCMARRRRPTRGGGGGGSDARHPGPAAGRARAAQPVCAGPGGVTATAGDRGATATRRLRRWEESVREMPPRNGTRGDRPRGDRPLVSFVSQGAWVTGLWAQRSTLRPAAG